MMLQIVVVSRKKMSTCQTLQQTSSTLTLKCRFLIRGPFVYIAWTVIQLVRPTLHKNLAALCLIISTNANPFYGTWTTVEKKTRTMALALHSPEQCVSETFTNLQLKTNKSIKLLDKSKDIETVIVSFQTFPVGILACFLQPDPCPACSQQSRDCAYLSNLNFCQTSEKLHEDLKP